MGIPSYFSHIIKEHRKIIKTYNQDNFKVNNLYMDANSIIYDSFYSIKDEFKNKKQFETLIYKTSCEKIEQIITSLNAANCFLAFDGVAPNAKLEQQRQRRFKSVFNKKIFEKFEIYDNTKWSTNSITPGTEFMINLDKYISSHFKLFQKNNPFLNKFIFSGCSSEGEGEHKIFDYVRNNNHLNQNTLIYGLDADLIMLSICHLPYCNNIYLYRETPEFIKSIDSSLEVNKHYLLDINELGFQIQYNITNKTSDKLNNDILNDYIFLCFFLGNDFMPHFPSLNIRKNGIFILQDCYCETLSKNNLFLTKNNTIQWKNVRKFISNLQLMERDMFIHENKEREKLSRRFYPTNNEEEIKTKILNIPTQNREQEIFINPNEDNWQARYYSTCFNIEYNDTRIKQICTNFLEALEWTFAYYTKGCIDKSWKYNYNYAPLLEDLYNNIPYFETSFFTDKNISNKCVSPLTQLIYVLPPESYDLLPNNINNNVIKYLNKNDFNYDFKWLYCKYFWESHIILPELNINKIESLLI
jgi:5'-3' exoribonuclease 1